MGSEVWIKWRCNRISHSKVVCQCSTVVRAKGERVWWSCEPRRVRRYWSVWSIEAVDHFALSRIWFFHNPAFCFGILPLPDGISISSLYFESIVTFECSLGGYCKLLWLGCSFQRSRSFISWLGGYDTGTQSTVWSGWHHVWAVSCPLLEVFLGYFAW